MRVVNILAAYSEAVRGRLQFFHARFFSNVHTRVAQIQHQNHPWKKGENERKHVETRRNSSKLVETRF